jgi:formylglycine-generating enzyme required for sulfatase activity/mono/diheme cytochrome c family protein
LTYPQLRCYDASIVQYALCRILTAVLALVAGAAAAGVGETRRHVALIAPAAVSDALRDMAQRWPERCGASVAPAWLGTLPSDREALLKRLDGGDPSAVAEGDALVARVRAALLALPLLDADRLLAVRRGANNLALPTNWDNLRETSRSGLTNQLVTLSGLRGAPQLQTVWQPPHASAYAGDLQPHWDARRLLFTSNNAKGRFRVFELNLDSPSEAARETAQVPDDDVDNYAGCWLADDAQLFLSTASMLGVPCVRGSSHIGHLFRAETDGSIRRLTFDQEHNWCPTLLADGRVMYLRWEYSDLPHFVARILFTMNPDGTGQRALYGSNSYWPNSLFYARPLPGDPRRFAAVVSGHHDTRRAGELIVFDPALGRFEADGVVQRIPGRGKPVKPVIADRLVSDSWPKFLHPYPLGGNYLLASCQPDAQAPWGLYLVDLFDNMTLVYEEPGQALLEPHLLQPSARPPVIPTQTEAGKPALVKVVDVYEGPGLEGIPRGAVKALRVISYAFSYRGMGGQVDRVGLDGPWDIKRVLGTVPVAEDGSAYFEVPPNTPVAFQPLDAKGRALQLMRSWITVMPGELQSCAGCHEPQNSGSGPHQRMSALERPPAKLAPWHGPTRGFSFNREVQPVLERHCVGCHNGADPKRPDFSLRPDARAGSAAASYNSAAHFPPAYLALRTYVRGHTIESDMHLLTPCEFHASTTELARLLEAGHHGVRLDAEAWDRLNTWIDLNTPAHGTWTENAGESRAAPWAARRRELMLRFAGVDEDLEDGDFRQTWRVPTARVHDTMGETPVPQHAPPAQPLLSAPFTPETKTVDLGEGASLRFARVPSGSLTTAAGLTRIVERPFWMGAHEVRNCDYARFDPAHDSRIETGEFLQFSERERGFPCNLPEQPVCRISRLRAQAFCAWLSAQTGLRCRLPSATEWEWAARAGSAAPSGWGEVTNDFSKAANLADRSLRSVMTLGWGLPSGAIPPYRPAATHVNDGFRVSAPAGSFQANAWGLSDLLGNVWEWTSETAGDGRAVACGGSWHSRPENALWDGRLSYAEWQPVYDVGFRIVISD